MHRAQFALRLASAFVVAGLALTARAQTSDFKAAKRTLQQKLRQRDPAARAQAVHELGKYPESDCAKLMVQTALHEKQPEVRAALSEELSHFAAQEELGTILAEELKRQTTKQGLSDGAALLLGALVGSEVESISSKARDVVDAAAAGSKTNPEALVTLADELATQPTGPSVRALSNLLKTKVYAQHFGCFRAVIQSLARIDRVDAVDALIKLLPDVKGEATADILRRLAAISGENFGADAGKWAMWWASKRDGFKFAAAPKAAGPIKLGPSYYYGLPLFAKRIVFVLDTSGSMTGPRLLAAKRELTRAISNLPSDSQFAIVIFNSGTFAWQKMLVPADYNNKRTAMLFIESQSATGQTASYDALESAYFFDVEAIYFVSDGAPTLGRIVEPGAILGAIGKRNRVRRLSIYTVGIGPGPAGSPMDQFLAQLALQNFGQYQRIEN